VEGRGAPTAYLQRLPTRSALGSEISRRRVAHLRHPDQVYELSADVYDLIHRAQGKDYAAEAVQLSREIRARKADATSLLDVACGTGGHLLHLKHAGDMRTFDSGRRYDAVTCLVLGDRLHAETRGPRPRHGDDGAASRSRRGSPRRTVVFTQISGSMATSSPMPQTRWTSRWLV
jgi:hypothetical protein